MAYEKKENIQMYVMQITRKKTTCIRQGPGKDGRSSEEGELV